MAPRDRLVMEKEGIYGFASRPADRCGSGHRDPSATTRFRICTRRRACTDHDFQFIRGSWGDVMTKLAMFLVGLIASGAFLMGSGTAAAEDIGGLVVRTLVLSENTRLIADVTCTVTGGPCIAFGAPNIVLNLNGFTITGLADPTA